MEEESDLFQIEFDEPQKQRKFTTFDYYDAAKDFAEFTLDEIDVFIDAFEEHDTDGSGSISAAELKTAFNSMGQGASDEMIQELIEEFDADKSGEIDWKEYLMMMRNFFPWKRIEYVFNYLLPAERFPEFDAEDITIFADAFREADVEKIGKIDANALVQVFNDMGQGCTEEDAEEILKEFDEDESGKIEFGEYLEIMRTCFYPLKRIFYEMEFYGPAMKSPEFSREEIDTLALSFKRFDKDNSGSIDIDELGDMFKKMGQGVSQEELEIILEGFDEDGSGEIEWPEFLEIVKTFYPWKRMEYEMEFYESAQDFPEFSRKELDVFSLTFREFDLDGSGSIDARELGIALKKMGQGASKEKIAKIIADVDDNGNGEIEWPEYLMIMRGFYPGKRQDFEKKYLEPAKAFPEFDEEDIMIFLETFRDYDLDGNGSISPRELEIAFKQMGQGASKEKIAQIIADVDDNGNGEIDWPEFLQIMRNMYAPRMEEPAKTSTTAPQKTATNVQQKNPAPTTPQKTATTAPQKTTTTATSTPVKSTTTTPAKTTTTASTTPAKTTSTTTAPQKTTTTATPTKTASSTSSTPVKSTTSSSSSTSTSSTPAKSSFGAAKPSGSGSSTGTSSFASHRANNTCPVCSKTVYAIEAVSANGETYHKLCFRCQESGCGISLTLTTFKGAAGKVYCGKHVPAIKPTQLTVQGSLSTSTAMNAPKVQKAQGIKKNERMTFAPGELKPLDGSQDQDDS